jgi:hypothetical protein
MNIKRLIRSASRVEEDAPFLLNYTFVSPLSRSLCEPCSGTRANECAPRLPKDVDRDAWTKHFA